MSRRRANAAQIAEAENLGRFFREQQSDLPAAPALDGCLMAEGGLLANTPIGEPRTIEILRAWRRGWNEAEARLNPPIAIEDVASLSDEEARHLAAEILLGVDR